jgi:hypothetical protein
VTHATFDQCERYTLNQLAGDDLARHEEHLLICESCQAQQTEADTYVAAMKAALRLPPRDD